METVIQFEKMQIIEKGVFNRYIVGQPNPITVQLYVENIKSYKLEEKNVQFDYPKVKLNSFNDINTARLRIDLSRLVRRGIFTFGDLQNILPMGLELHQS